MEPVIQWKSSDGKIHDTKEKAEASERFIRFLEFFPDGFFMMYKNKKTGVWEYTKSYLDADSHKIHYHGLLEYLSENPEVVKEMAKVI